MRDHIYPTIRDHPRQSLLRRGIEGASRSAVHGGAGQDGQTFTAGPNDVVNGEDAELIIDELGEMTVIHLQRKNNHDHEGNEGQDVTTGQFALLAPPHSLQQLVREFRNQHETDVLEHGAGNVQVSGEISRNLVQHSRQ